VIAPSPFATKVFLGRLCLPIPLRRGIIPLDPAIVSGGYLLRGYGGNHFPQSPEAKKEVCQQSEVGFVRLSQLVTNPPPVAGQTSSNTGKLHALYSTSFYVTLSFCAGHNTPERSENSLKEG
jgi:hypothetical protein